MEVNQLACTPCTRWPRYQPCTMWLNDMHGNVIFSTLWI